MRHEEYWVVICAGETVLGGGTLLNRFFVLTAEPCLRELPEDERALLLYTANGDRLDGTLVEVSRTSGLALISVAARPGHDLATPSMDHAVKGDEWFAPYRPTQLHRRLTGTIDEVTAEHRYRDGPWIKAIRLTPEEVPEDYAGFGGGPVERHTAAKELALVGILMPPEIAGHPQEGSADTLVAGAIGSAMEVFDGLSALCLAQWLVDGAPEATEANEATEATGAPAASDTTEAPGAHDSPAPGGQSGQGAGPGYGEGAARPGPGHVHPPTGSAVLERPHPHAPGPARTGDAALPVPATPAEAVAGVAASDPDRAAAFAATEEGLRFLNHLAAENLVDELDTTPFRVAFLDDMATAVRSTIPRRGGDA
ncbi:hypothetical protein ACWF94_12900 [Streptomyces sp. NPDC055078]